MVTSVSVNVGVAPLRLNTYGRPTQNFNRDFIILSQQLCILAYLCLVFCIRGIKRGNAELCEAQRLIGIDETIDRQMSQRRSG